MKQEQCACCEEKARKKAAAEAEAKRKEKLKRNCPDCKEEWEKDDGQAELLRKLIEEASEPKVHPLIPCPMPYPYPVPRERPYFGWNYPNYGLGPVTCVTAQLSTNPVVGSVTVFNAN